MNIRPFGVIFGQNSEKVEGWTQKHCVLKTFIGILRTRYKETNIHAVGCLEPAFLALFAYPLISKHVEEGSRLN